MQWKETFATFENRAFSLTQHKSLHTTQGNFLDIQFYMIDYEKKNECCLNYTNC